MHKDFQRRTRALAIIVTVGWMPSAIAQALPYPQQPYPPQPPQPYPLQPAQPYPPQPAQPYPPQTYAPQPFAIQPYPQPYGQPYVGASSQPPYTGAYPRAPVVGVPLDRNRGDLEPGEHRFSLLVSIVHPLAFSIYDASGEFRLSRYAGLALVVGVGSASLKQFYKSLPDERATVWAGGLQARFYPVGSFDHGFQVGAEVVYLTGSTSTNGTIKTDTDPPVSYTGPLTAQGNGFKVGPFVGYKLVLPVGFTLAAQFGVDYLSLKGLAKDDNGHSRSGDAKTALLLADAGVGWSF